METADQDGLTPPTSRSRPKMLTVGLPALLGVSALIAVPFLVGSGSGDDSVRTRETSSTFTAVTTTTTAPDDLFTAAASTDPTPESTTPAPSTTRVTTTTTEPPIETLPEQPAAPIAPPPDPRGAEDQIQLGGISIPKLDVEAPLLEGIRLTTLDNGPGHWPGTAMPGEVGNVVVAGHRTSHGAPFRDIDQLVPGDIVLFETGSGQIEYTVTGTQIVEPDAVWIVDPTDTPTATLFACHPPGSVTQRIVVHLELAA